MISLSDAADAAGVSKSTLLRAIKSGRLSAAKNDVGSFQIDPAELFRVYSPASHDAPSAAPMIRHASAPDAAKEATDALVAQLQRTIEDLRNDRDDWKQQAQRLALPRPEQQQRERGFFARVMGR